MNDEVEVIAEELTNSYIDFIEDYNKNQEYLESE